MFVLVVGTVVLASASVAIESVPAAATIQVLPVPAAVFAGTVSVVLPVFVCSCLILIGSQTVFLEQLV